MSKHRHNRPKPKAKAKRRPDRGPTPRRHEPDLMDSIREAVADGANTLLALTSQFISLMTPPGDPFGRQAPQEGPTLSEFVEAFLDVPRMETSALLTALQVLLADEALAARIGRELSRRTDPLPAWLRSLGDADIHTVREHVEVLEDGEDLVLGVRLADGDEVTVVVYVDHNMNTVVKDAFVLPMPVEKFDTIADESNTDGSITRRPLDPATARARISQAIEHGERTYPPMETDSWPLCKPVVQWLVGKLPDGGSGYAFQEWQPAAQEAVVAEFLASPEAAHLRRDPDHAALAEDLVWFGCGFSGTDPYRWSNVRVEILMLDWIPRKIVSDEEFLAKAPAVLRALIRHSHAKRGVPAHLTAETLRAVDEMEPEYQEIIRSERLQGPEALLANMGLPVGEQDLESQIAAIMHRELLRETGGQEVLDRLTADPLPDEPFDWVGIPDDIHSTLNEVLAILDRVVDSELDDVELRSACRRLLARAARGKPVAFRRAAKPQNTAAAICWLVGRANRLFDVIRVQDLLAAFGVGGSVSQRGKSLMEAAGLQRPDEWLTVLPPEMLTSQRRRDLIDARDRYATT